MDGFSDRADMSKSINGKLFLEYLANVLTACHRYPRSRVDQIRINPECQQLTGT